MGFVSHRAVALDSDGVTYRAMFLQLWMDQGLAVIAPTGSGDAQKEADADIEAMKAQASPSTPAAWQSGSSC